MITIDLTMCDSEGEIRRLLHGYGVYGVNPWLARSIELHDTYALVTSAMPDERGRPTRARHTTRHERENVTTC
jgi:hypothetical protein